MQRRYQVRLRHQTRRDSGGAAVPAGSAPAAAVAAAAERSPTAAAAAAAATSGRRLLCSAALGRRPSCRPGSAVPKMNALSGACPRRGCSSGGCAPSVAPSGDGELLSCCARSSMLLGSTPAAGSAASGLLAPGCATTARCGARERQRCVNRALRVDVERLEAARLHRECVQVTRRLQVAAVVGRAGRQPREQRDEQRRGVGVGPPKREPPTTQQHKPRRQRQREVRAVGDAEAGHAVAGGWVAARQQARKQ
eukprot:349625-Chlamydomonas_euryale.AAC.2